MSETPGTTPTRSARAGRAAAASALGVLVALAAHLAGGGSSPPPALLVAAAVLVQPLAVLLAGRRPALWRQASVVGLGQLSMHATFALGSGGGPAAPVDAGMGGMAGMHPTLDLAGSAPAHAAHTTGAMWGWHVAAWLVTTVAWRWGEAAASGVLARVVRVGRRRLGPVVAVAGAAHRPAPVRTAPPVAGAARTADPRRGPPVLR